MYHYINISLSIHLLLLAPLSHTMHKRIHCIVLGLLENSIFCSKDLAIISHRFGFFAYAITVVIEVLLFKHMHAPIFIYIFMCRYMFIYIYIHKYLLYFLDGDQEPAKLAELLHVDQLKRDETSPALAIDTRPIRGPVGYLVCLSVS